MLFFDVVEFGRHRRTRASTLLLFWPLIYVPRSSGLCPLIIKPVDKLVNRWRVFWLDGDEVRSVRGARVDVLPDISEGRVELKL